MNKMSAAAVFVAYFPSEDFYEYINTISTWLPRIIVVENTPGKSDDCFTFKFKNQNVEVIFNEQNLGIAAALNLGIDLAAKEYFEHVFLFDQDSRIAPNFFVDMLEFKKEFGKDAIICAPNFYDVNSKTYAKFSRIGRFLYKNFSCVDTEKPYLESTFAITSGTLLDIKAFCNVGCFRDDYFIDHVDSEYCLRAAACGYGILINPRVTFMHAIGKRTLHKFLFLTIKPNNHAPVRRYYIARNGIHSSLKHFLRFPAYAGLNFARLSHEILAIVLYEDNRYAKLKGIMFGIYDGIFSKMGPCRRTF